MNSVIVKLLTKKNKVMKKNLLKGIQLQVSKTLTVIFVIFLILPACEKKQDSDTISFKKKSATHSECKNNLKSTFSELPCVTLHTTDLNYLAIEHVNAVFNCSFDSITISAEVTGNIINIKENHVNPSMYCTCNYDIEYVIGPLEYGHYTINIMDESDGMNEINFEFDFSENTSITYCL